jgi:hypothetical protein
VHGAVGAAFLQSVFEFLGKQTLAADCGERNGANPVAGGAQNQKLHLQAGREPFEFRLHPA